MPVFLFTDIEGSTQLWEIHGRVMGEALSRHDQILHDCVTAHGGRIIKHTGDGVFAVFDTGEPLQCALAIGQQIAGTDWGPIGRLRVRIALHAGDAEQRGADYFGSAVNRTARLLYAAWGGQILLTDQVVRAHRPPENAVLRDYGVHMLKDLGHPQQIFGLLPQQAKAQEFPPLRSLSTRAHNLPPQPTPFIGRRQELAEILHRLDRPECRMLTIVGPGGVGKTRLALQVGAENIDAFPHGVYQVSLAPLSAANSIVTTIADALNYPFSGSEAPADQLWRYLYDKEMLLILDNFEHLMDGVDLVADLLAGAPRLKLIVTSRERLNLHEEWTFELVGMEVPEQEDVSSAEQFAAVQLFLNTAYRVYPNLSANECERRNIVRICQLVEGLPLAIELASSWVRVLTCQEIADEIAKSRDFLVATSPNVPARHQSLRAIFEYSWHLLLPHERDVLRRLSVFRGGMQRDAAQQVAGATLPVLLALADKSLLRRSPTGRYEMLEAVRQYAREKLAEDEAVAAETQRSHTAYYMNLLRIHGESLRGGRQREALAALSAERENGRRAWQRTVESLDVATMRQGLDGLYHLYEIRGWLQDGFQLFDHAVNAVAHAPHSRLQVVTRAQALARRGWFAYRLGRLQAARRDLRQSLAICLEWNEPEEAAGVRYNLGVLTYQLGQYEEAERLLHESLQAQRTIGDTFGAARTLSILGIVARDQGDKARAAQFLEESLALHRALDEKRGTARCLNLLALLHRDQGRPEEARTQIEESLELARDIDDISGIAYALSLLGVVLHELGDYVAARDYARESLEIRERFGDRRGTIFSHNDLGRALMMLERYDAARDHLCQALAAAEALETRPLSYYVLASFAELAYLEQRPPAALRFAALIIASGTSFEAAASSAQRIYGLAAAQLSPEEVETIWEEASVAGYDEYVREILADCGLPLEAG
jgi:predicted ATPase/class 3 adenylate cyclase/Flp pilus assembly protein TadD